MTTVRIQKLVSVTISSSDALKGKKSGKRGAEGGRGGKEGNEGGEARKRG